MKNKVQVTLRCLSDIWDEIGIGKDSRVGRLNSVCEHLTLLCDNMLTEEKGNLAKMKDTVQNCNRELDHLCMALNVPYYQVTAFAVDFNLYFLVSLFKLESD